MQRKCTLDSNNKRTCTWNVNFFLSISSKIVAVYYEKKINKYSVFIYRLDILMKNHNITGGNLIVKTKKKNFMK